MWDGSFRASQRKELRNKWNAPTATRLAVKGKGLSQFRYSAVWLKQVPQPVPAPVLGMGCHRASKTNLSFVGKGAPPPLN